MLVVSFHDLLELQKMLSWFQGIGNISRQHLFSLKHEQRERIFPHIIPINYILEWHDISSSRGSGRLLAQIAGHNNLQLIYKEKYFLQGIYIYWLGGLRNSIKNISAGNNKLLEWNNHFTKLKIRKTQNLYKSQFKNKNGTCYTQRELNV